MSIHTGPRISTADPVSIQTRLPDARSSEESGRSLSSLSRSSRHTGSPSPVSLARSSSSSSHSPMTLPPPQSPQLMSRTVPTALSGPSPARRISLVSLGSVAGPNSTPNSPHVPPSPVAVRSTVPTVKDLRSQFYQTRICGQDGNLVRVLRAATQGQTQVGAEGKVEVVSSQVSPAVVPSSPLTPRTAATAAASPSTPSSSSANGTANATATTTPEKRGGQAGRRVYVGLAIGPSHGNTYWQEKMVWPMEDGSTNGSSKPTSPSHAVANAPAMSLPPSAVQASSTPSTPRGAHSTFSPEALANRAASFHQLLLNLVSLLPPIPSSAIGPARETSQFTGSSVFGSNDHAPSTPSSANSASDGLPNSARLSRRPSATGQPDDGWTDGEVVLSVFLLLDTIDVDSKQITFIAPTSAANGKLYDLHALFQLLYKADLTQPSSSPGNHSRRPSNAQTSPSQP